MNQSSPASASQPVFKKCVRCSYALRGLPANHACPECGLRFDEDCALYRVTNPKQLIAFWLMVFGGGWVSLRHLRDLPSFGSLSAWDKVGVLAGLLCIVFVVLGVVFLVRRSRRGFLVAITGDGLIVQLPGFKEDLIPWDDIGRVTIKERPVNKPQIALVYLNSKKKSVPIGGVANVFPDRPTVERFVQQVTQRLATVEEQGDSSVSPPSGAGVG